jgi:hypothetical protein
MSIARRTRVRRFLVVLLAAGACRAATPAAVPVLAPADALAALAGRWEGEYSSPSTGRSGSIVFTLAAGRDTAYGDVVMVPAGSTAPLAPATRAAVGAPTVVTRPTPQGLTIRFVRVSGDSVTGVLEPYSAPDCGCVLTTTFMGRLEGDRIAGTFETRGDPQAPTAQQGGRWSVTRRTRRE